MNRLGIFRTLVLSLFVAVIGSLLLLPPAGQATPGADSPDGDVPLICGNDELEDLSYPGVKYAAIYVPAWAKVDFEYSGVVTPAPYVAGLFIGQYNFYVQMWAGETFLEDSVGIVDTGYVHDATPIPFSNSHGPSWTNSTGVSQIIGVAAYAVRRLSDSSIDWSIKFKVDGGEPGICRKPIDGSELFGPNPSMGQQCPPCTGGTSDSVDTRSGNEHRTLPGLTIPSRGPGLDFQLGYNSLAAAQDGPLGHGWSSSYGMSLIENSDGTRTVFQETGSTVTFSETSSGQWVSPKAFDAVLQENADGTWRFVRRRAEFFNFHTDGRLDSIEDRNGYRTTLHYAGGDLAYVEDDAGRRLVFDRSLGRITKITDPLAGPDGPRKIEMSYTNGDLTSYKDIGGGQWTLGYDTQHRLTSVRSPRFTDPAKSWKWHYDAEGRVDWEEDPQGRRTEIHYDDPAPGSTRVVEPDGDARVDIYDAAARRTSVIAGYGTPDASTTQLSYDSQTGMLTATVDGRGKTWATQYSDPANPHSPTRTIDPLGRERRMTYDAYGQITSLTDAAGVKSTWAYDAGGNLTTSTVAKDTVEEATTGFVYGDANHPGDATEMVDPRGKRWTYTYDPATGDKLSATDPLGNRTTWGYNNVGWLTSTVAPKGNAVGGVPSSFRSTVEYDKYGAPVRTRDALGRESLVVYDPDGNVTKVIEPDGDVTRNTWTDAGQLATTTNGADTPAARTVSYTYASDGRLTSWSADPASVWTTAWDALGRMATQTDPNGEVTTYGYDGAGNLTSLTQPGGDCGLTRARCVSYQHDDAGQLTKVDYSDPATPDVISTYDDNGYRLTQQVAGQGTSTWAWTRLGQLARHVDGKGEETSYAWDRAGNLETITYPGQSQPVSYEYDDAGRMAAVTDWLGNRTTFDHDENSNLTKAAYPSGTGLVDKWTYNRGDEVNKVLWDRSGGGPGSTALGEVDYTRDPDGFVATAVASGVPGGPTEFDYDPRNQLKSAAGGTGAGTYASDDRGYLTQTPDAFNTFDPAGQLESSRQQITVVGATKFTSLLGNSYKIDLPAGLQAGDQILLVAVLQASKVVESVPAGYELVVEDSRADGARIAVYRKTAVGDESSATVKFSGGAKSLMAAVYRGVDPTAPVAATSSSTANDTNTLSVDGLSAPASGTQLVLAAGGANTLLAGNVTGPAEMTTEVTVNDLTAPTGLIADRTLATGGPTGPVTVTFNQSLDAAGVLLALRPKQRAYSYDEAGNRTAVTGPAGGGTTSYSYDQAGRLTGIDYPAGASTGDLDGYQYDGDGLRTQAPVAGIDTHFTWGRAGALPLMLTETTVKQNGDLDRSTTRSYVYGPGGRVLTRIDPQPDIELVGTGAVAHGSANSITTSLPAGIRVDDQILIGVTHANTTTPTLPDGYTEVGSWPNSSTVTRLWRRTATGSEGASLKISFSSALLAPKAAVVMVYRGVDPTAPIVDSDAGIAQGTSVSIPSLDQGDADNEVVAFGGSTFNLLSSGTWSPPTGFTARKTVDATSIAAIGADQDTGSAGPTGTLTFGFSATGRQVAVGVVLRQAPPPERWHHTDHLGSTRLLTDEFGRTVGTAGYTPYGTPAGVTGETSRFGYAGQYTDPDTGLIYLRARYYDPVTSQFLTRDPLLDATQDPYGYAANNPANLTDPTGMCPVCVAFAVGAAVGGGLDLLSQVAGNWMSGCSALQSINWGSVAVNGAVGGITGGVASAATKAVAMAVRANQAARGLSAAKTLPEVVVPQGWNAATKLPSGGTVRDVGNRIWGHGLPSPDRLAGMTDDELRALASLDDARMLNAMYRGAGPGVPNNATAPVRVDLSQLIIDAWSRK